jgi:hypothetical protein
MSLRLTVRSILRTRSTIIVTLVTCRDSNNYAWPPITFYLLLKTWFPYGRKNRVTIFLKGQFIIVYTCKPHIKYYLVIITPRIFSSGMLYFGWWERSWLILYDRYNDHFRKPGFTRPKSRGAAWFSRDSIWTNEVTQRSKSEFDTWSGGHGK